MQGNVSKAEFARLAGVTRSRVSHWISAGDLSGDALVREGRTERVNVEAARRQLGARVDVDQRISPARGSRGDTLDAIQRQKLAALELANAQAREAAMARSGRYTETDVMRLELGRVVGRVVALYDGILPDIAASIAAASNLPVRDALHLLRTAFRAGRERIATAEADAAATLPQTVEAAE
jgi:hypothetical protein